MTKPIQQLVRFDWAIKSILRDKANFYHGANNIVGLHLTLQFRK